MKSIPILFILLLLNACTSTPPQPMEDYKSILSSHEPLTDAQLEQVLNMLGDARTNPDVQGYIFDRLSTEEYSRFEVQLEELRKQIQPDYIISIPQPVFARKMDYPKGYKHVQNLLRFHQPNGNDEIAYYERMLDFMELPIPYNRKINGLRNIQRVMASSDTHRDLNAPELKAVRKRLYDLALSEKSPDIVRRELAAWLKEKSTTARTPPPARPGGRILYFFPGAETTRAFGAGALLLTTNCGRRRRHCCCLQTVRKRCRLIVRRRGWHPR
jgi:hypothetical protein